MVKKTVPVYFPIRRATLTGSLIDTKFINEKSIHGSFMPVGHTFEIQIMFGFSTDAVDATRYGLFSLPIGARP